MMDIKRCDEDSAHQEHIWDEVVNVIGEGGKDLGLGIKRHLCQGYLSKAFDGIGKLEVPSMSQSWEIGPGRIVAEPRQSGMAEALCAMLDHPRATHGGNSAIIISNFIRAVAKEHGIDLEAEVLKRVRHG